MQRIRSFDEADRALKRLLAPPYEVGQAYTLERMHRLMDYLDNPQDKLKVVHVAGTSGKTSTAYYVAALLTAKGLKTGLTVSPHINIVSERVQIGTVPMAEAEFCRELGIFLDKVILSDIKATYFELLTAFAYWEYERQQVDYAVIEVGLGGLKDSTNVFTRPDKVCVITDIGLDHTGVLGTTLPEIAFQKAGIIYPGNTVFCYRQSDEIMQVFQEVAEAKGATLNVAETVRGYDCTRTLPLFQRRNFGLAFEAVSYIQKRDGLAEYTAEEMNRAAQVLVPGRMEMFRVGSKTVVLDGAHNPQKLAALCKSMQQKFSGQSIGLLLGFIKAKEPKMKNDLRAIMPLSGRIVVTGFTRVSDPSRQAMAPEEVATILRRLHFSGEIATATSQKQGFQMLLDGPEDILLVTGSFYLLGSIRQHLLSSEAAIWQA